MDIYWLNTLMSADESSYSCPHFFRNSHDFLLLKSVNLLKFSLELLLQFWLQCLRILTLELCQRFRTLDNSQSLATSKG